MKKSNTGQPRFLPGYLSQGKRRGLNCRMHERGALFLNDVVSKMGMEVLV